MTDYVKCLECSTEKSREDTFLDIPLPVRPFGSMVAYGSVEEALRAFVQPETLEGNNQYICDVCSKKCDAHKGLKFSKFPYLLTLHLKRFDFDYSTMHRIKLNDKLVFPEILDLNNFVKWSSASHDSDGEGQESGIKCDDSSTADSALDEDTSHAAESQNNDMDQDEDEGIDLSSNSGNNHENEKNRQQYSNTGPFIYELYSIMIHSGSASGGHYYAYIKDFTKGEWYCFNDQSVTSITNEDIKKTYGGSGGSSRGYYSGAYSSSTNAYMLMYRQINKELNCSAMSEEEFPPHIKKLLFEIKESEEKEKALRAKQEEMVRIKVHTAHPMIGQPRSNKMFYHNDQTMAQVKSLAYNDLKLNGIVPEDQCRLVSYNKSQDEMEESLDGREKDTISEVFSSLRCTNNYELFLEIRDKDKVFLPYNIGDINLTVYIVDNENEAIESVHQIRTSPCQNLTDFKKLLQLAIPLKSSDFHIFLSRSNSLTCITDSNELSLNKLGFSSCNRVFLSFALPDESEGKSVTSLSISESRLYSFIDEVKNIIIVHLILPDASKESLDQLLIPPLAEESLPEEKKDIEDKPSDSTPTGEGITLVNGLDEEPGYGSGAGGTSDQSTSEDSSLTDSERTIIGEVMNEGPLSSPSDSDQQLSSCDSHVPAKTNQVNGEMEEMWDIESKSDDTPPYYFNAQPYSLEDGQRMLRVVVDRSIDIRFLKKKLEKYVGVDGKFIILMKGTEGQQISISLRGCKDDERITIKLERVLSEGEHRIAVNRLVLNATNSIQYICDWIVSNGTSISSLKKSLLKEIEHRAGLKIPYERCRLREQSWKSVGGVMFDSEEWNGGITSNYHQKEVYIQELEGPDPVTDHSHILLFTRHWNPTTFMLGPFDEIVLDSNTSDCLRKKLSEISNIPVEHLKFEKGMTPYPCEMSISAVNHMFWELDKKWNYSAPEWEREDGAVLFYRDGREELKTLKKEEQQESSDNQSQLNTNTTSSSYISGYSPRKERALKIYLDTTPRRSRSAIDVD